MRRFGFLICGLLLAVPAVNAQAFETLTVSGGIASNVNRTRLHESWSPGAGGDLRVSFPFHVGYVAAGIRYIPYGSIEQVPAFDGALFYGAWGLEKTASRATVGIGVRAGSLRMAFDSASETAGLRNESELTWGIEARLSVRIAGAWSVFAGGSAERTMTKLPMDLQYLSMGASFGFSTPDWLRGFLQ